MQVALTQEDYEEAATHIHRFLSLDADVFQLGQQWEAGWQLRILIRRVIIIW